MTGPSQLNWLVNFLQICVSMSIVAVCVEGLSLTVWATFFRVNSLEGKGGTCLLCKNLSAEGVSTC